MCSFQVIRDPNEKRIHNVQELRIEVDAERQHSHGGAVWVRGLSDAENHKLLPSIGRPYWYAGEEYWFDTKWEKDILHRFRRYAYDSIQRVLTEWEALFVGRHNHLPVRVMDWTSNPLVALFFASEFEKNPPCDGRIWLLVPNDKVYDRLDVFSNDVPLPLAVSGVRLIYPPVIAGRLRAQSGFFTIQENPWMPVDQLDSQNYPTKDCDIHRLRSLIVDKDSKREILRELNELAINSRTMYPDLIGLSKGILADCVLRQITQRQRTTAGLVPP